MSHELQHNDPRSARSRSVLRAVRRLVSSASTTVLYECRRCGASLEDQGADCPHCGPTDAVRYEF